MVCVCVLGSCNARVGVVDVGDEEKNGRSGWRTRDREGQYVVVFLMRKEMVVFNKETVIKVRLRIGNQETELEPLVARKQHVCRVKVCMSIVGEYVSS